jgi:hypothetical protein
MQVIARKILNESHKILQSLRRDCNMGRKKESKENYERERGE